MRYYDLSITPAGSSTPKQRWTSYPGGKPDPNALNIMLDMIVAPYATPIGMQTITVEGISLADLQDTIQYAGMNLTLKAGMGGGLPLENKNQQGIIVQGNIFQAFGNWVGTDMTVDFVINPGVFTQSNPGNFVLNWNEGTLLSDALNTTLTQAYAKYKLPVTTHLSKDWVAPYDIKHSAGTIDELADQVAYDTTLPAGNGPAQITIQNGKIVCYDNTYKPDPIQLVFTDFIGQPTWIKPYTMQVKTVMRADIQLGSIIKMPKGYLNAPGAVTTTAQSVPSSLKYKPTFTQNFTVTQVRQLGNFRSSDSGEWATIINCVEQI